MTLRPGRPLLRAATRVVAIICVLSGVDPASVAAATKSALPEDARHTIAQLQQAAGAQDFTRLRSLMTDEFIWSFGGDADADQAIDAWRADTKYLGELHSTLRRGCHLSGQDKIECAGKGGLEFRAGLARTPAGWRLEYLVAGD